LKSARDSLSVAAFAVAAAVVVAVGTTTVDVAEVDVEALPGEPAHDDRSPTNAGSIGIRAERFMPPSCDGAAEKTTPPLPARALRSSRRAAAWGESPTSHSRAKRDFTKRGLDESVVLWPGFDRMSAPSGKIDEPEPGSPARSASLMDTVPDDSLRPPEIPEEALRRASAPHGPVVVHEGAPGRAGGPYERAAPRTPSPSPADATSKLTALSGESRTFGKYRLLAELGRGGMADVHLAVSVGPAGFSKLQVIKRLRPGMTDEAEMRHMMLDEARLAARLNHKNIVQTNEVGIVDEQYFLAMEYLDGQPYHRILKRATQLRRSIPLPFAVKILCEVLSGLHYAHECRDYDGVPLGVVHRDVSPQNLFVTYDGQVKVVDFGIAKSTGRLVETQTGIIRGKLTYMAPEQAFANSVDRRADIFSVGVLLWEALAGERLWGQMSDPEIVARLMQEIPPVTTVRPDAPADLVEVCSRALSRNPEKRPATAAEMRGVLEEYLALHDIQVNAEALGSLVVDLFAEERDELSRLVDRELALLRMGDDLERSDIARVKRLSEPSGIRKNFIPGGVPSPSLPGSMRIPNPGTPMAPSVRDIRQSPSPAGMRRPQTERGDSPFPPDSSGSPTLPRAPAFESDEGMTARELSPPVAVLSNIPGPPSSTTVPAAMWNPRPRWRHPIVYVAALSFVAVVAILGTKASVAPSATGTPGLDPSAASGTLAPSSPATAGNTAPSPVPTVAAQPDGNYLRLHITTNPATTRILFDGSPLPATPSPFEGKFPKDGAVHRITVEAAGFYPQSRMVVFDKDQSMDFILHSKKGAPPPKENPYH
jgi:serine/threonine-protein kinase